MLRKLIISSFTFTLRLLRLFNNIATGVLSTLLLLGGGGVGGGGRGWGVATVVACCSGPIKNINRRPSYRGEI